MQIWIPNIYCGMKTAIDECTEITLPDYCPTCNEPIVVESPGNKYVTGYLYERQCIHLDLFSQLWEIRIVEKPKSPGEICCSCNDFVPMSEPNQPDGKFKCYICRQNPYR
jgi:hypothetical protein